MNLRHGHGKKLIMLRGDLDLIFKVTLDIGIAKIRPKNFKCTLSSEWVRGFTQICMYSIYGHENKPKKKMGDLTLTFKVTLK